MLDFGAEVYSWIGRKTCGAPRKKAAEIGLNLFNKGRFCCHSPHPTFSLLDNLRKGKICEKLRRQQREVYVCLFGKK